MSWNVVARVWKSCGARPLAKLLLLAIADHANDDGYAYPGIARLASRSSISPREVRRLVQELEDGGYLIVDRMPGRGNRYVVDPEGGAAVTSAPGERGLPRQDWGLSDPATGARGVITEVRRTPESVEAVSESEGIHSAHRKASARHTATIPTDALDTIDLYQLHRALTGELPDAKAQRWLDDLTVSAGQGAEGRSAVARVMRRWWSEGRPAGKHLIGWTKYRLRTEGVAK